MQAVGVGDSDTTRRSREKDDNYFASSSVNLPNIFGEAVFDKILILVLVTTHI